MFPLNCPSSASGVQGTHKWLRLVQTGRGGKPLEYLWVQVNCHLQVPQPDGGLLLYLGHGLNDTLENLKGAIASLQP